MPIPAAFMKRGKKAAEGSAAEEAGESPDMEKAEGPDDNEMKGKKPCKACAKKGKKKGSCSCDKGGKMDAALTPMEYLDACDLGIQDRSKSYIRARLDAMATAGKGQGTKCGNGYIGRGKKCRSAGGGLASTEPSTGTGNKLQARAGKALNIAAGVGGVASTVQQFRHLFKGDMQKARAYGYASNALGAVQGQGRLMEGKATGNEELQRKGKLQRDINVSLGVVKGIMSGDILRTGEAAATGYQRAQSKKAKLNTMSNSEYSTAQKAAGNDPSPFRIPKKNIKNIRTKLERKVNQARSTPTTARRGTVGMLRGS
jgi:hypothetical protein